MKAETENAVIKASIAILSIFIVVATFVFLAHSPGRTVHPTPKDLEGPKTSMIYYSGPTRVSGKIKSIPSISKVTDVAVPQGAFVVEDVSKHKDLYPDFIASQDADCSSSEVAYMLNGLNINLQNCLPSPSSSDPKSKDGWVDFYGSRLISWFPFLTREREITKNIGELGHDYIISPHEAWNSGAASWDEDKRLAFINDPDNIIVTWQDSINNRSGKPLGEWSPNSSHKCELYYRYIKVKSKYGLGITEEHRDKVAGEIDKCLSS